MAQTKPNKYLDYDGLVELWKSIAAADKLNATAIETEASRADIAEKANAAAIEAEAKRADIAEKALGTRIDNLDYDSADVQGAENRTSYISAVTQTDGKIAVEKAPLPVHDIKVAFQPGSASAAQSVVVNGVATITYDDEVTDSSKNAVQSAAIHTAIEAAKSALDTKLTNTKVSAEGDTLVTASADTAGRKITVAATEALTGAVAKANSAVQAVIEGTDNGTIKVDGVAVPVHGLGDAAYTTVSALNSTAQGKVDAAKETIDAYTVNDVAISEGVSLHAANLPMSGSNSKTIATEISEIKTAAGKVKIAKITEGLPETVAHRYILTSDGKTNVGDMIDIPKDLSLDSVLLVDENAEGNKGQYLKFTYNTATGGQDIVYVDVSKLLSDAEMKKGLHRNEDGTVDVLVDPASQADSEKAQYLSVSAAGVKVSGINEEIAKQVAAEASRADAAEKVNASAISTEKSRAEGEESRIEGLVTAEASTARAAEKKNKEAAEANALAITTLKGGSEVTIGGLDTRVTTNTNAITTLKGGSDATIAELVEADSTNAGAIEAEIARAKKAEGVNTTAIAKEAETARAAESGLDARITLNTNAIGAIGALNADEIAEAIQAAEAKK